MIQGWALDEDEEAVCAGADEVTQLLGVRRLIVGHTPHFTGVRSESSRPALIVRSGHAARGE